MTEAEIDRILRNHGFMQDGITIETLCGLRMAVVQIEHRVQWSYETIKDMARDMGTTQIDFIYGPGWVGSDYTPGDPGKFRIKITWSEVPSTP